MAQRFAKCRQLVGVIGVLWYIADVRCEVYVFPRNLTVFEHESVPISCYTSLSKSVVWEVYSRIYPTGWRIFLIDVVDLQFKDRVVVSSVGDGHHYYNITFVNVTQNDTGHYICTENGGYGAKDTLDLIVIGINVYTITHGVFRSRLECMERGRSTR